MALMEGFLLCGGSGGATCISRSVALGRRGPGGCADASICGVPVLLGPRECRGGGGAGAGDFPRDIAGATDPSKFNLCGVGAIISNCCCVDPGEVMLTTGGGMRGVGVACVGAALCFGGLRGRCIGLGERTRDLPSLPMSRLARGDGRCDTSNDRFGVGTLSFACSTGCDFGKDGFEGGTGGLGFDF